jgi:hypothetical protein
LDDSRNQVNLLKIDIEEVEWLLENDRQPDQTGFAYYAPPIFERYLRILDPAHIHEDHPSGGPPDWREVRWREITDALGVTLRPDTNVRELLDIYSVPGFEHLAFPGETSLSERLCHQLVSLLRTSDGANDACLFGFASSFSDTVSLSPALTPVEFKGEMYFFAEGSCDQLCQLSVFPTYWWPKDRAWLLVTPLDMVSSAIGCDVPTAESLLAAGVEALSIEPWVYALS